MKKSLIITLILLIFTLLINLMFRIPYLNIMFIIFLCVAIYLVISEATRKQSENEFLNSNMHLAKNLLLNSTRFIILIVRDKKIIWCNDLAYEEFPILLTDRTLEVLEIDPKFQGSKKFKRNNRIYSLEANDGIYIIENITDVERSINRLVDVKPNIGILKIDNYDYIRQTVDDTEFFELEQKIRSKLVGFFEQKNIYYNQLAIDTYQLLIPTKVLSELIDDKFKIINEGGQQFSSANTVVTFSFGIATNFENLKELGEEANDALDLAINRGGGQVVLFDNGEKYFFGGNVEVMQGSTKIKARVMSSTILKFVENSEVVYILTHQFPDSDAVSATLLMRNLILQMYPQITVKVILDERIPKVVEEALLQILDRRNYDYDYVVDKTKSNLLVVVDTQSSEFISHPKIIDEIESVVIVDHHQTPIKYIDNTLFNWIEPTMSSTTEMIVEMYLSNNIDILTKDESNFALMGILTDTNNLTYRTKTSTLEVIAYLVEQGATFLKAVQPTYVEFEEFLKINKIVSDVYLVDDVAVIRTQLEFDDIVLSMCANKILEIKGVNISIIVSEIKDNVNKVKLRTQEGINAKLLIEKYNGGGHARQAAGVLNDEDVYLLLNDIKKENRR